MALNAGFAAPVVMQLGGWKTEKMMRRYAAVTDQTLRAAAEAVRGSSRTQTRNSPRSEVQTRDTTGADRKSAPVGPARRTSLEVPPPACAGADTH
jgi:hypothetical protein